MDVSKKAIMETKDFKFSLISIDEDAGTFTGYASVFGVVDSYGDKVMPGAFRKTIKEHRGVFPLLFQHNIMEIVGVLELEEDAHGLRVKRGSLNLDVQRGREVRSLMKQGALDGLSIGYQVVKADVEKESGIRLLREIKLWEVSLVLFPANEAARVEDVKDNAPEEGKPYPNIHACRLRDPNDFEEDSIRTIVRKHEGKEYQVLIGKLKKNEEWAEQSYHYPKSVWTESEARKHCESHDGQFEAAEKCVACAANIDDQPADDATGPGGNDKPELTFYLLAEQMLEATIKHLILWRNT